MTGRKILMIILGLISLFVLFTLVMILLVIITPDSSTAITSDVDVASVRFPWGRKLLLY